MRRFIFPALVVILTVAVVQLSAHLAVSKTFPATDSTVTTAPNHLQIWFTQAPTVAVSALSLEGPKGKVEMGKVAAGQADGKPDRSLVAPIVGTLEPGKYTGTWKTSGSDGHIITGTFAFSYAPTK